MNFMIQKEIYPPQGYSDYVRNVMNALKIQNVYYSWHISLVDEQIFISDKPSIST